MQYAPLAWGKDGPAHTTHTVTHAQSHAHTHTRAHINTHFSQNLLSKRPMHVMSWPM